MENFILLTFKHFIFVFFHFYFIVTIQNNVLNMTRQLALNNLLRKSTQIMGKQFMSRKFISSTLYSTVYFNTSYLVQQNFRWLKCI